MKTDYSYNKKTLKKYLFTSTGIFPGYRTLSSISKLTETERFMLKDSTAILFKVSNGEIVRIHINGKIQTEAVDQDDLELRLAYKKGYNQALEDNNLKTL